MSLITDRIGWSCFAGIAVGWGVAAQATSLDNLMCGIEEHNVGNTIRLDAWVSSYDSFRGQYELRIQSRGSGGTSVTVQSGKFVTPSSKDTNAVVSQVVINKSDYEASFVIRAGGRQKLCAQERPRTNTHKPGTDV